MARKAPTSNPSGRASSIGNKGVLVFDFAPGKAALTRTYFPASSSEAKQAASMGIDDAVKAFDPAMRKTEAFVRKRLVAKGLKDPELKKVYDKIIGDMRYKVA